jgi:hypothetical protein
VHVKLARPCNVNAHEIFRALPDQEKSQIDRWNLVAVLDHLEMLLQGDPSTSTATEHNKRASSPGDEDQFSQGSALPNVIDR